MSDGSQTGIRRPNAQVSLADLPACLRRDANEMNGWGAGNEAEHTRQAADEIERLRGIIRELSAVHVSMGDLFISTRDEIQ